MGRKNTTVFKKGDISDESDGEDTKDGGFVLDPEQLFDDLPQPFRLIDKTLNYIFDKAWEAIEILEIRRDELGLSGKIPLFDCARRVSDVFQPNLMCSSSDGKYVFIVSKSGVIQALDASSFCVIAVNEELLGLNVLSLSSSSLDERRYFVSTLMDNGSAGLFVLSDENFYLLRVFNEESSTKNSVPTCIFVSFDGNFVAVGWKSPLKSSWLDVYKVPTDFWINEIEIADKEVKKNADQEASTKDEETSKVDSNSLKDDSSDSENDSLNSRVASPVANGAHTGFVSDTSFTKPSLVLKVRSPTDVVPNTSSSAPSALKMVDPESHVVGSGTNHILLQQYFDHSYTVFKNNHQQYLQYLAENEEDSSRRIPRIHFLTPGKFVPTGSENQPDQVNSILVHWSEDCLGYIYSLAKTTKDVERKPEVVLTMSSRILVSDVSVCKTFISFGLENRNIITWDKLLGLPLNVVDLPTSGAVTSLHFIPTVQPVNRGGSQLQQTPSLVKLLASCDSNSLYMLQYCQDLQVTISSVPLSSWTPKDPVVQISNVPNLPKLVIVQRRSGMIAVIDVCTNTPKCLIGLIKPDVMLQGFCYAHEMSMVYMRGGQKDEYDEEIVPETISAFTMNIHSFPVLKCYYKEELQSLTGRTKNTFEKRIEEIERERIYTQEKRQRHRATRWRQYEAELKRKKKTTLPRSVWFNSTIEVE